VAISCAGFAPLPSLSKKSCPVVLFVNHTVVGVIGRRFAPGAEKNLAVTGGEIAGRPELEHRRVRRVDLVDACGECRVIWSAFAASPQTGRRRKLVASVAAGQHIVARAAVDQIIAVDPFSVSLPRRRRSCRCRSRR
jgi:hypothetical protein